MRGQDTLSAALIMRFWDAETACRVPEPHDQQLERTILPGAGRGRSAFGNVAGGLVLVTAVRPVAGAAFHPGIAFGLTPGVLLPAAYGQCPAGHDGRMARARDSAPDAVVIGAGHNGLVAANLLADAGWDVVVCEATPYVGGAVRSGEVTAPGYICDLFSAFYPLSAASPVLSSLDLHNFGLRWTQAPAPLATVFADDSCVVLQRDVEATAASFERFGRGDGDAWRAAFAQWEAVRTDLLAALFRPFPPAGPALRLARTLGIGGLLRFARMSVLSVRRMCDERFTGDGAAATLAGCALHADLSPDTAGSGFFGWLIAMLGQTYGFPVPVGGSGKLTEALAARLSAHGGSVRISAPVQRVLVRHGAAAGVRLESGEVISARHAVLAAVNAPALYEDLVGLDALPAPMVDDLRRFEWDVATLKVDWALSRPIPWTAGDAGTAGTVHLGAELDNLTQYASDLARRRVPAHPLLLLGQMTTADASRSPSGTESAWAYTHLPVGSESERLVDEHVALMEEVIEARAPGFRDRVVARHVQSPSDLQRANPNLVHGATNGGTAQLHQQLFFRPLPGLGGAATPIDGLFLAGSSAHPGGGVHGACGANAAHTALARRRLHGKLTRVVVNATMRRIYR